MITTTIIFFASMCFKEPSDTMDQCNDFYPYSWTVSSVDEKEKAYAECSILSNAYDRLEAVKETDCFEE